MKRAFFAAIAIAFLMHAILDAQPAPQATGLKFFKNYTVTGIMSSVALTCEERGAPMEWPPESSI